MNLKQQMDWREQAIAEARAALERTARQRSVITYSDLVDEISAAPIEPDSKILAEILDKISRASEESHSCMLSAVVVHKGGNKLPAPDSSSWPATWAAMPLISSPSICPSYSASTRCSPSW